MGPGLGGGASAHVRSWGSQMPRRIKSLSPLGMSQIVGPVSPGPSAGLLCSPTFNILTVKGKRKNQVALKKLAL